MSSCISWLKLLKTALKKNWFWKHVGLLQHSLEWWTEWTSDQTLCTMEGYPAFNSVEFPCVQYRESADDCSCLILIISGLRGKKYFCDERSHPIFDLLAFRYADVWCNHAACLDREMTVVIHDQFLLHTFCHNLNKLYDISPVCYMFFYPRRHQKVLGNI